MPTSKSRATSGSSGYALPLVVVAIAVFLLYAGESAARLTREVRVIKTSEHADMAFYAAEAGFNRVRARLIKKDGDPLTLNGRTDTLMFSDGTPGGSYSVSVSQNPDGSFYVESVGTYGSEPFAARRIVRGTIAVNGTKANGDRKVTTEYSP